MLKHVLVLLAVLSSAALAACGDDDSDDGASGPDAGGAGENAGGKAGGQSGGGRGGSNSGGAAGAPGASVKCGSATCEVPGGIGAFVTPCCADEAQGVCGMSLMGSACSGGAAAAGDPRCPSIQAMGLFTIPSCCTTSGQCGIDASMFGFGGCTDLASAAQMSMMSGSGTAIPAPRMCGDASDAGTDDAGR